MTSSRKDRRAETTRKPPRKKYDKATIAFLLFLLIVAAGAILITIFPQESGREKQARIARTSERYPATIQIFQDSQVPNTWLVTGNESDSALRAILDQQKDRILNILEKFRPVSDLTAKIADKYTAFSLGVCTSEHEDMRTIIDGGESAQKICLIPRSTRDKFYGTIYYARSFHEVRIYGVEMPEVIFAARLEHELGHVYRYEVDGVKDDSVLVEGTKETYTDGRNYSVEEVLMAELEGRVLDFYAHGTFYKYLDEVMGRFPHPEDPGEAAFALQLKDFQKIQQMEGAEGCGWKSAIFLAVQIHFALGFRFIDQQLGGNMDAKIRYYGWTKAAPKVRSPEEP